MSGPVPARDGTSGSSELPALDDLQVVGRTHTAAQTSPVVVDVSTATTSPSGHTPLFRVASSSTAHLQPLRHQAIISAANVRSGSGSPRHAIITTTGAAPHPTLPTYRQASVDTSAFRSSQGISFPPSGSQTSVSGSAQPRSADSSHYSIDSSLPDILNSHVVPQIPPARPNQHRQHNRNRNRTSRDSTQTSPETSNDTETTRDPTRERRRHRTHGDRTHRHRHRRRSQTTSLSSSEGTCKEPCVKCVVTVTSFRWVLVVLSVVGVCCVVTGVVLAALHAAGNSFLFLAVMFVGLGVLLVIVVAVGWKCTPRGHEPLHALFGIGTHREGGTAGQTRERRHRRHRNRDAHWYGGVMYPEFQHRRPPPSYAASMQDYQNQPAPPDPALPAPPPGDQSLPNSPPPSYRSRSSTAHSAITSAFPNGDGDHSPSSRPPTYRSRAPSRRPSLPEALSSDRTTAASADVSFTGASLENNVASYNNDNTNSAELLSVISGATSISVSLNSPMSHSSTTVSSTTSPSSPSSAGPVSPPIDYHPSPSLSASETMQVYTVPLVSTAHSSTVGVNIGSPSQISSSSHSQSTTLVSPRDSGGIMVQVSPSSVAPRSHQPGHRPVSSSSHPSVSPSTHRGPSSPPRSLHQRMESGDRVLLEQALQSLEDSINETEGVTNEGACFEDMDFDTHL